MTDETTVTFAKKHNYGGHAFEPDDKLTLPASKAKALKLAGVLKAEKKAEQ